MFVVELANEGTGVALAVDVIVDDLHMHLGQLALGAADVLFDELVQTLAELLFVKLAVDDVVGVVLAAGFLENGLRRLLEAKEFEDVLLVGSEVLGDISQIDDVALDAVALAFNLHLHLGHEVSIVRVVYC